MQHREIKLLQFFPRAKAPFTGKLVKRKGNNNLSIYRAKNASWSWVQIPLVASRPHLDGETDDVNDGATAEAAAEVTAEWTADFVVVVVALAVGFPKP